MSALVDPPADQKVMAVADRKKPNKSQKRTRRVTAQFNQNIQTAYIDAFVALANDHPQFRNGAFLERALELLFEEWGVEFTPPTPSIGPPRTTKLLPPPGRQ